MHSCWRLLTPVQDQSWMMTKTSTTPHEQSDDCILTLCCLVTYSFFNSRPHPALASCALFSFCSFVSFIEDRPETVTCSPKTAQKTVTCPKNRHTLILTHADPHTFSLPPSLFSLLVPKLCQKNGGIRGWIRIIESQAGTSFVNEERSHTAPKGMTT